MVDLENIAWFLISTLIYPGLAFLIFVSLLTQWFYRKTYARMQNRMGPSYVGPFGVLQPFADFIKLMFSKEDITTEVGLKKSPAFMLSLGIGSLVALLLLTPLSPFSIAFNYDIIIVLYLTFWASFTFILVGFMAPNPYTITGTSRYLSLFVIYEPIWVGNLLIPVVLVSKLLQGYASPTFSLLITSLHSALLWSTPITAIATFLSLISILLVLQAKVMFKPFDIPEAEQEVVAGPLTEYSGPKLALIHLLHDIELTVYSLLIVILFLGGPSPFTYGDIKGIPILIIKYLLIVLLLTIIKASVARMRIDHAIRTLAKISVIPTLIALALTVVYVLVL